MESETPLTPTGLSEALGISLPYASQLLSGSRRVTLEIALRIFHATGRRLGPIAHASDDEIVVLSRFGAGAAPAEARA